MTYLIPTENPMLHVPINIRHIPSPTLSPTVEQKDFIPNDNTPIVVESASYIAEINEQVQPESPATMSPPIGSPNLQSNILTQMDPSQVIQIIYLIRKIESLTKYEIVWF